MVIGPNGTGKSTLVCAICLGLGWKTEHLGRAKELAEFIKHGQNQAEIEIELAADPARHSENQVVRHTIRRSDKDKHKSTYHLNDKQCTHKMITELCRSFSIQVDNLCQFLPQDRVVEFAALSSVDLLTQTQRAAAPPHLVERHEKLKELRAVEKKCLDDQSIVMEGLKSLESRQNNQRADVERLHERQEIKEKLEALEMLRPVAAYRVARANWDRIKGQKKEAADELIALEKAAGPAQRAVQARRDYQMAVGLVLSQRVRVAENAEKRVNALLLKQDKLKEDIKSFSTRSNAEQDTLKKQKQERSRLESNVGDLKVTQSQAPPAFDAVAFNERLREATRQSRLVKDQIDENEQKYRSLGQDLRTRVTTQKSLERQIADLRSQAGQQGNKLRAASRDAFDAWSWIQANPDKIPGPVFGPPIVSCSVKDPKHAIIIENALSAAEMQAFTVTTQEAYQVLQRVLYKDMKLADINIRVCKKQGLVAQARPVPQQELGQLGLDTYVIDLIDGPSEVLEMMCQSRMIHQTGVAFRNVSDASAESISKSRISSYVTPTETFTIVRRREYGDQGTSIRTQRLRPAQFFGSQTVDVQAEQDLKRELQEVIDQAEAIQTQGKGYKQTIVELQDKVKAIESDRRKTQEEKDEQQQALTQFNGLGIKLQALERKLESLEHVESESRTRSRKIHIEHSDALMQRAKDALLIENAVTILHRLHVDLSNCQILSVEAQSEYERVDGAHKDVRNNLKLRADHLETLKTELERSKTAAKALLEESNRLMQQRSQKQADFHAEQPEKQLPEDLDNDIVSLTVRLEMFHEGDPNVLRDYEQRAAKIERAQQKIKATERELGELGTQIATLRQQWEPELDRLVSQMSEAFAENFSRIGCAGEVRVHKEDDFANWAIQVMVKFRYVMVVYVVQLCTD